MVVYRCKEPFAYADADGTPISVGLGDIMDSNNPEFEKRRLLFDPVVGIEDASAEPGMLRSLAHRRRGRPPKKAELTDTEIEADKQAKPARVWPLEAESKPAPETTADDEEKK